MTPREHAKTQIVGQWLRKADADLALAERLLLDEEPFLNAVAFHCQQAAEKCLKALLTRWDIEFPKTHVLASLIRLVQTRDAALAASLLDAVVLTPYGVELRYPGDRPDVSEQEAREALALARKVRRAIVPLTPERPGPEG